MFKSLCIFEFSFIYIIWKRISKEVSDCVVFSKSGEGK
jgi:hypothetical protein